VTAAKEDEAQTVLREAGLDGGFWLWSSMSSEAAGQPESGGERENAKNNLSASQGFSCLLISHAASPVGAVREGHR
jgi:hypothetical protein